MSVLKIIALVLLVPTRSLVFVQSDAPPQILLKNVRESDGTSTSLSATTNVLIVGNKIQKISTNAGNGASTQAQVIDGGERVLMPGLIESHAHLSFASISSVDLLTYLPSYAQIKSVADAEGLEHEIQWMARLLKWYKPVEILKMATGNAGELLKLSGDRNPYPGDLGVIKEGAYAEILLVDSNPLDDITVIGILDNLRIIIKDGKIYKNTL